jgi:hypothetical protein
MITETVLEMHYHKPIMDLVRTRLGLGGHNGFNFYKYSPQNEAFIGFDQAYVKTHLSEEDFLSMLKKASNEDNYHLDSKYVGFFLQFKVVKKLVNRKMSGIYRRVNPPYYRVSLNTTRKINTGVSQHELLYNLNRNNQSALVFYACPMIFDRSMLYEVNVDLSTLRLADLSSCPSAYTDNNKHFIIYEDPDASPVWCSEPVEGTAIDPESFAQILISYADRLDTKSAAQSLLTMLTNLEIVGVRSDSNLLRKKVTPSILPFVGESLTIVKIPIQIEQSS